MLTQTIGFIGAGQMARALARGLFRSSLVTGDRLHLFDPDPLVSEAFAAQFAGAWKLNSNAEVLARSEIIILAVKPQNIPGVMAELAGNIVPGKLLISIAAGVTISTLCEGFQTDRVVRVMPNTPALVMEGASAYALGPGASAEDGQLVGKMLGAVGKAYSVEEKLLDAVTGLSGSGPAFVYVIIEALSDGGVRMGLPREVATALAAQTVLGSAQMVLQTGEHPAVLKDKVASPGGTTIAGLQALEQYGLRGALIAAVEAATKRSAELGK